MFFQYMFALPSVVDRSVAHVGKEEEEEEVAADCFSRRDDRRLCKREKTLSSFFFLRRRRLFLLSEKSHLQQKCCVTRNVVKKALSQFTQYAMHTQRLRILPFDDRLGLQVLALYVCESEKKRN